MEKNSSVFTERVHTVLVLKTIPQIIQGGMGAGVSGWRLAQAVSKLGHLGVISGTALDQIMVRRLQEGDIGGHFRRALEHFPFKRMAQRILDAYWIPGGKKPNAPYKITGTHTIEGNRWLQELTIAGNFIETFLAREGHRNFVGMNYLEKIQLSHLPAIYGAMLAGVAVIIMGAGIPLEIPAVINALSAHQPATYPIYVTKAGGGDTCLMKFDPASFHEGEALPPLNKPLFLPIVSSVTLATVLKRRIGSEIAGLVVEGPSAGGHNAPPRGKPAYSAEGELLYGPRDQFDIAALRALGIPFWMAGSYGSPEKFRAALAEGAAGIQVGTAFALCVESEIVPEIRRALIQRALAGKGRVFTDPVASPTGFPFKLASLDGTLSEKEVYNSRRRTCDLGFLRQAYRKPDGSVGYRCAAGPVSAYLAQGGKIEETVGRMCLCNGLVANIGLTQALPNGGHEPCMLTLGDDYLNIGRFCTAEHPDYSAADVIRILLG